jgi:hypothetical protein
MKVKFARPNFCTMLLMVDLVGVHGLDNIKGGL